MSEHIKLVENPAFWNWVIGVTGVVSGFLLSEGHRFFYNKVRIWKLKKMLKKELKSVQAQIPQKINIVKKIITALGERTVLSGLSVGIINIGYTQYIAELYEHLSTLEINCLHVIYERLKIADEVLCSYDRDFTAARTQIPIDSSFQRYKDCFADILDSYSVVQKLIEKYLKGNPTDVFYVETRNDKI